MKKLLWCHFTWILAWICILSVPVPAGNPGHRSLCLWTADGPDFSVSILGSIHVLGAADYPLDPAIESAYRNAEAVYFEIDMDSTSLPAVQGKIMMAGMLKGQTLSDVLGDSVSGELKKMLLRFNVPFETVQAFKPWFVASMLTMIKLNALGVGQQYGVDQYFYGKALGDQKRRGSMEAIADQIGCFSAMDKAMEQALLLETLNSLDSLEYEFLELKTAWATGDVMAIDSLMNRDMDDYPELSKVLVGDRNRKWAERVKRIVRNRENAMIIVGAGHLVGKESLIELLGREGMVFEQQEQMQ
ncbi:TraB/GumN family protein [bacterium]|nr:TraB/GumN family protein [bacterium]